MRRRFRYLVITLALTAILFVVPATHAQGDQRCFPETGQCISGRIRAFWEQNGGLPVFGFPIAPQQDEMIEGKSVTAQPFERNRLELHPENQPPYDVLLGRLGVDRLVQEGRDWFAFPKSAPQSGCRFFAETGHNICGAILKAWSAHGLLLGRSATSEAAHIALFGLPLSDAQTETIDGKEYLIQWFERARFEIHPENPAPYDVLLGLLGNETQHGAPVVSPPPPVASAPQPLPIDNPYYPLKPGTTRIYEGISEGHMEHNEVTVTDRVKVILGVPCVEVHDIVLHDGQLIEETLDWYAQDKDGNVRYYGEDSREIEDGKVVSTEGSWEAGVNGAEAGIIMEAHPQVGDTYRQEFYKGHAEDMAEVFMLNVSITVPYGSYTNALVIRERTPLEPDVIEEKHYAPGVGMVQDVAVAGESDKIQLVAIKTQ
jgi:hypothetical protein